MKLNWEYSRVSGLSFWPSLSFWVTRDSSGHKTNCCSQNALRPRTEPLKPVVGLSYLDYKAKISRWQFLSGYKSPINSQTENHKLSLLPISDTINNLTLPPGWRDIWICCVSPCQFRWHCCTFGGTTSDEGSPSAGDSVEHWIRNVVDSERGEVKKSRS